MADIAKDILDDSGYKSRKYVALYVFWTLVTAGFGLTIWKEAARAEYSTYGGLLLAGLGTYFGVNLGHKFVASKKAAEASEEESITVDADDDPTPAAPKK